MTSVQPGPDQENQAGLPQNVKQVGRGQKSIGRKRKNQSQRQDPQQSVSNRRHMHWKDNRVRSGCVGLVHDRPRIESISNATITSKPMLATCKRRRHGHDIESVLQYTDSEYSQNGSRQPTVAALETRASDHGPRRSRRTPCR